MFSFLTFCMAERASRLRSAVLVYRTISLRLAWPVIAAISCGVQPASASRTDAALRKLKSRASRRHASHLRQHRDGSEIPSLLDPGLRRLRPCRSLVDVPPWTGLRRCDPEPLRYPRHDDSAKAAKVAASKERLAFVRFARRTSAMASSRQVPWRCRPQRASGHGCVGDVEFIDTAAKNGCSYREVQPPDREAP
jgi:hypothetical protein